MASARVSAAHASHVRSTKAAASTAVAFLIRKKNAVDKGVCALCRFDGFSEGFLAAAVDAVGEDDERFAALLLFHQFIGGEVDGVVQKSARTAMAVPAAAVVSAAGITASGGTTPGTGARELRGVDLVDGSLKFLARGGKVLEELDLAIEMDDKGFVLVLAEDVIEEGSAGGKFLVEDAALAEAGVNKKAEGEREVGFIGEIRDGLRLGVLFEKEVVFGEVVDEGVVFVADGNEEIDGVDVDGNGRGLLRERRREVQEAEEGKEVKKLFHGDIRGVREE